MSRLISVIMPAYNAGPHIKNSIESVINQTYKEFELIIIDDGSTDDTAKICKEYCDKYSNVILISKENEGVSKSRNIGLDISRGEYIFFIDSDDMINCKTLEVLISNMKEDIDITHIETKIVFQQSGAFELYDEEQTKAKVLSGKDMIYNLYDDAPIVTVSIWGYLYRKNLFFDIRFPEDKIRGEDEAIIPKIFYKCRKGVFLNNQYYYYYQNPDSVMHKKNNRLVIDQIDVLKNRIIFLESIGFEDLTKRAFENYLKFTIDGVCKLIKWNRNFVLSKKIIKDNIVFNGTYFRKFKMNMKYKLAMKSSLFCLFVKLTDRCIGH